MENSENEDNVRDKAEHVVDDAWREELPTTVVTDATEENHPCGPSSQTLNVDLPKYIEGFEKDLERCLEKTAALRALADVELVDARTPRTEQPRHPNPKCYCPSPICPPPEQEFINKEDQYSTPPSPAHGNDYDDDQSSIWAGTSAMEAQSENTQVDVELAPEKTHVFVMPKLTLERQPIVGLTVKKVDTKKVMVVVDDPLKHPKDAKLSFLILFSFADTMDYLLMFLGSLGACAHGVAVPIFFVFFGRLINAFGFNQHHPHRLAQEVGKEALSMFYLGLVVMFASWMGQS